MLVPLKSLHFGGDKFDSRAKVSRGQSIDSLANSISRLGLILPLSVVEEGAGKYRVIDGNRRLEALKQIHKGQKDVEVPVHLQDPAIDQPTARAVSLAANIERLPLHPVDQYEAFAKIAEDGKSTADVAAIFGISERTVKQRMALGQLSEEVKALYRQDKIRPSEAAAFTRVDKKTQVKLLLSGESMWKICQELEREVNATSVSPNLAICRFIGREAYVAAGGTFLADLFVPEDEQRWADPGLLERLAQEKYDALAEDVGVQGWAWIRKIDGYWNQDYVTEEPEEEAELDAATQEKLDNAKGRLAELDREYPDDGEEAAPDAVFREYQQLDELVGEIAESRLRWSQAQKDRLGVVVDGNWAVVYGARGRNGRVEGEGAGDAEEGDEAEVAQPKEDALSASLMAELDARLTNAVHDALVDSPGHAVRLLTLTFLSDYYLFEQMENLWAGVGIRCDWAGKVLPASEHGLAEVQRLVKASGLLKAKNFEAKMKAMWKIDDDGINQILAYFVGRSIQRRHRGAPLVWYLDKLGKLDIRRHWTPDQDSFFSRLTKEQLLKVAADMGQPDIVNLAMKKGEIAAKVEAAMPEKWIPDAIRPQKPERP
jgi:ParB family transcriptional regulator, chromosome partitioning protein